MMMKMEVFEFELEVSRKMSGSTELDSRRFGIRLEYCRPHAHAHAHVPVRVWIVVGPSFIGIQYLEENKQDSE